MNSKPTSLMAACKDYFGLKPNQTAMEFLKEFKELTDADRDEIKVGLEKVGYVITTSPTPA